MKLLLTGAGGFFGQNLLDLLSDKDNRLATNGAGGTAVADLEVHTISRSEVSSTSEQVATAVATHHTADLFDSAATAALISDIEPTHLCHMAWLGPETQDRYRSPDNQRWVDASRQLFEAFARFGGQRLVHLGSCIEYGNSATGARIETQPLAPDTAYGSAKAELSRCLVDEPTASMAELSVAVARPFFCYGPHEQPDRLVPSLILALHEGRSIDLTEGRQRRDYLDARDVASALWALLRSDATGAFNIGSGEAVEVRSIAEQLGEIAGRPDLLNFGGRGEGADTAMEIVADISRITSATDWSPSITLEMGLRQTTNWWLQLINASSSGGNNR